MPWRRILLGTDALSRQSCPGKIGARTISKLGTNPDLKAGYNPAMDRLLNALDYIEGHLSDELSVADVAGAACLSPFHFARTFRARTGWSVMAYVQARRLSVAAQRLQKERPRLIELALDSGFESQATFTRAFKRKFEITPGRLNRVSDIRWQSALTQPLNLTGEIGDRTMLKPRFVDKPAFKAAGLKGRFDSATRKQIDQLWDRFNSLADTIPGAIDRPSYGICLPPDTAEGAFDYYAAFEIKENNDLPASVETIEVPAQHYAVFTHKLIGSDITESLWPTIEMIWERWLPASDYEYSGGPDFELYDERFKIDGPDGPHGEFDIYIPLQLK
jgi:AraC family transcriptional regulator